MIAPAKLDKLGGRRRAGGTLKGDEVEAVPAAGAVGQVSVEIPPLDPGIVGPFILGQRDQWGGRGGRDRNRSCRGGRGGGRGATAGWQSQGRQEGEQGRQQPQSMATHPALSQLLATFHQTILYHVPVPHCGRPAAMVGVRALPKPGLLTGGKPVCYIEVHRGPGRRGDSDAGAGQPGPVHRLVIRFKTPSFRRRPESRDAVPGSRPSPG